MTLAAGTVLYTRSDDSGWLKVKDASGGGFFHLCEYTQVTVQSVKDERIFFVINDVNGGYAGRVASLSKANEKYLSSQGPGPGAIVHVTDFGEIKRETSPYKGTLDQEWGNLSAGHASAQVTLNSVWGGKFTPIPPGSHRILAPDNSHASISTEGYRASQPKGVITHTDVWFPIEVAGSMGNSSRYIHIGHLSDGCVTVHELDKWTAIYQYLISNRIEGYKGKYVGSLIVIKKKR